MLELWPDRRLNTCDSISSPAQPLCLPRPQHTDAAGARLRDSPTLDLLAPTVSSTPHPIFGTARPRTQHYQSSNTRAWASAEACSSSTKPKLKSSATNPQLCVPSDFPPQFCSSLFVPKERIPAAAASLTMAEPTTRDVNNHLLFEVATEVANRGTYRAPPSSSTTF